MGGSFIITILGPGPGARRTVGVGKLPVVIGRGPGAQMNITAAQKLARLHFALVGNPQTGGVRAEKREGDIAKAGQPPAPHVHLADGAILEAGDIQVQVFFPFPTATGKPLRLQVLHGPRKGEHLALPADGVTIGRHPRNSLALESPKLSSFHARIRKSADGWTLTDLNSRNGTRLNGVPLPGDTPHLLDVGDIIDMVDVSLRLVPEGVAPLTVLPMDANGAILTDDAFAEATSPSLPAVDVSAKGTTLTPVQPGSREGVPPFDPFVAMGVSQRPGTPRLDGPALIMAQGEPRAFKLKGPVRLGRGTTVDIRLLDEGVSQEHAEIAPTQDGYFTLRDLDSLNGVRINGTLVNHAPLDNFDVVGIGNYRFLYIAPGKHFPVSRKSVGLGLSVYPRKPSRFLRLVEVMLLLLALLSLTAFFVYSYADWSALGLPAPPRVNLPI